MDELRLMPQAALTMVDAVVAAGEYETGGMLAGPDFQRGGLLVTHATGPGPRSRRTPNSFRFDRDWCQRQLDRWSRTMRIDWIGDWHLHPSGFDQPSPTDYESALRLIGDPQLRLRRFLLLIAQPPVKDRLALKGFIVTPEDVISTEAEIPISIKVDGPVTAFEPDRDRGKR